MKTRISDKHFVVNFFGGPGCGKSTLAAGLFYSLKRGQIPCEYVQEYIKTKIYEGSQSLLNDQLMIVANQNHNLNSVYDKVLLTITDSPILLSMIYNKYYTKASFNQVVLNAYNKYNNINYFVRRSSVNFDESGRLHTLKDSIALDKEILQLLDLNSIPYHVVDQTSTNAEIINILLNEIDKQ